MGEYARINRMLEKEQKRLEVLKEKGDDVEAIIDCENGIGEIRGALIEMAQCDGLDDIGQAFDF